VWHHQLLTHSGHSTVEMVVRDRGGGRERENSVDSSIFVVIPWLWCIIIFVYIGRFVVIRLWCWRMFVTV